jgi:sugar (pentulose or hexulose) kinase
VGRGGASNPTWRSILAAITGRRVVVRRSPEAASVGARVLAARAADEPVVVDAINPVVATVDPDATDRAAYAARRPDADRQVAALLAHGTSTTATEGGPA